MLNKFLAIALLSAVPSAAFAASGTDLTRDPAGGTIRYPHIRPMTTFSYNQGAVRTFASKRDPAGGIMADRSQAVAPRRSR